MGFAKTNFGIGIVAFALILSNLAFAADPEDLIPRPLRATPTICGEVHNIEGRAILSPGGRTGSLGGGDDGTRASNFLNELFVHDDPAKRGSNAEALWEKYQPLGRHYLISEVPVPRLNEQQAKEMRQAVDKVSWRPEEWPTVPSRVAIKMVEVEARFLKANQERIAGLREAIDALARQNKKLDRQETYRQEIAGLAKQSQELEESILSKYAQFIHSHLTRTSVMGIEDNPEDIRRLARATYSAALHRAKRLGLPHREITLSSGHQAIEFLADEVSEVGKLARTVHRMTAKEPTPYRLVFAPEAVIENRGNTATMFVSSNGYFGLTPEFFLSGNRDHIVMPLQLRMLQMVLMQEHGAATPFRGEFAEPAPSERWRGLYEQILQGAQIKNFPKAFAGQSEEMKVDMARNLHNMFSSNLNINFLAGIASANRAASRAIGKVSLDSSEGILASAARGSLVIRITDDPSLGDMFVAIAPGGGGVLTLYVKSAFGQYRMPLKGKDVQAPLAELLPLLKQESQGLQLTSTHRESLVRLLRIVQRTTDVAQKVKEELDVRTLEIKNAAAAYVHEPTPANEETFLKSVERYKEPPIDRLTLRGFGPEEIQPEVSAVPAPVGLEGPRTPEYLVQALALGRAAGTGTSEYRKALEEVGMHAVRTVFEQRGFDTRDRGPDQKGYDVIASTRVSPIQEVRLEVKATSDPNGSVGFTPNEILFARQHLDKGDWVLAVVVVDADGNSKVHFRRGIDLGPPLPPKVKSRPFLIHDLLTMGTEVPPDNLQQLPFLQP